MRKLKLRIKRFIYKQLAFVGLKIKSPQGFFNGFCRFNNKTIFGKNVHFNGLIVYGRGKVTIGNNFHSGSGCKIITQIHNYKGTKLPYDEQYIKKDVVIEDNVWLGMDVLILGGVSIGEGAIIQAGSVVSSDIEPLSIAGGNPARAFSTRDAKHYNHLKNNNKFH